MTDSSPTETPADATSPTNPTSKTERTPAARRLRRRVLIGLTVAIVALLLGRQQWWVPLCCRFANSALAQRDAEAAHQWLDRVTPFGSECIDSRLLRGRAFRKQGNMKDAAASLIAAQKLGAPVERLQREKILGLAQSGQLSEALPFLPKMLTDPQGDADEICEAFVMGYMRNQRMNDALGMLDAWEADSPENWIPVLLRGQIYSFQGQSGPSKKCFQRVLEMNPQCEDAMVELGLDLEQSNKPQEAIVWLEKAQHSKIGRIHLAACYRKTGDTDRAKTVLAMLRDEFPDDAEILRECGRLEVESGEYESAIVVLEAALEYAPKDDEAHYLLGQALQSVGRTDDAKPHFDFFQQARAALDELDGLRAKIAKDPFDADLLTQEGKLLMAWVNEREGLMRLMAAVDLDADNQTAHQLLADWYTARAKTDAEYRVQADKYRAALERIKAKQDASAAEDGSP